jgi:hypothetical protein
MTSSMHQDISSIMIRIIFGDEDQIGSANGRARDYQTTYPQIGVEELLDGGRPGSLQATELAFIRIYEIRMELLGISIK